MRAASLLVVVPALAAASPSAKPSENAAGVYDRPEGLGLKDPVTYGSGGLRAPDPEPARLPPPAPAAKARLAGNVLVWADASWYTEADATSPSIQLTAMWRSDRMYLLGRVIPAKVVATRGDFVEVELRAASDCTWTMPVVDRRLAKLRLYVRRADIAPVVTRRFAATYKDGSKIAIAPGVPVIPKEKDYVVSINGDEVTVAIPPASVGHAYRPAGSRAPRELPRGGALYGVAAMTKATLGRYQMYVNARTPVIEKRTHGVLLSLEAPCIAATVAIAKDQLVVEQARTTYWSGIGSGSARAAQRWFVPAGTNLLTKRGRVAAVAASEIEVDPPAPGAKTACARFTVDLVQVVRNAPAVVAADARLRTLELCAPVERVKEHAAAPPRATR